MKRLTLVLVGLVCFTLGWADIIYEQDFEDFVFTQGTQVTSFGVDDEWAFNATGSGDNRLDYEGDWGSGYYAGFRGNDFVMGYQHTSSTGTFTATLEIENDTGEELTDIQISYLGRIERVELTRYPEWTVTVNGTEVPSLSYSTEIGSDQMRSASVGGLSVAPEEIITIVWTSTRGPGTGASCQIGIADLEVSLPDPNQVSLPTFDPQPGTYGSAIDVVIECVTEDATIHYTLDGTDPDQTSPVYTEPIHLDDDTTLKARAYKDDMTPSNIATGMYIILAATPVDNLGSLRQGQLGELYTVTGEVILTFQQSFRNQKYIQDASGAILIDDDPGVITTSYNRGDGITGMTGTLSEYGNMLQFVPVADPGPATSSGNTITPAVLTVNEMINNFENYEAQLVRLRAVSFEDGGDTFENGQVYPLYDATATGDFRTTFYDVDYIGTTIPTTPKDIVGILNSRSEGDFITSRDSDDIQDPTSSEDDSVLAPYSLGTNYPNPFNPETNISFSIGKDAHVTLTIYNIKGEKVKTLIDEQLTASDHSIVWDGTNEQGGVMPSGVYFYRMDASDYTSVKKMLLLK
jgi:hypothetical protein